MFTSEEIMCGKGGEARKFVFGHELRGSRSEGRNGSFGTKLENEERRQKERRLDRHSHFHLGGVIFGLLLSASFALNIMIMIGKAQNNKRRSLHGSDSHNLICI